MIIKPSTILVIFCNVLIFMFFQILLFWYVISKEIENIIIDKSLILHDIIQNSTVLHNQLIDYTLSEEYLKVYNQSIEDSEERNQFNISLTWTWMFFPFTIVILIIFIGISYAIYIHRCTSKNNMKLDKTDMIILITVFLSFLTEIIFIFVLIMEYEYVSDMDIIIFFIKMGSVLGIDIDYLFLFNE